MKKLPSIAEDYLADLRRIRVSGGATGFQVRRSWPSASSQQARPAWTKR